MLPTHVNTNNQELDKVTNLSTVNIESIVLYWYCTNYWNLFQFYIIISALFRLNC